MPEFRLLPEDWPRLEALAKCGSAPLRDVVPAEYANLQKCGFVCPRRNGERHVLAVTPAGYAMLAERERLRDLVRAARDAVTWNADVDGILWKPIADAFDELERAVSQ